MSTRNGHDNPTEADTMDAAVLGRYLSQDDPVVWIGRRTLLLATLACALYLLLAVAIPNSPGAWYPYVAWAFPDLAAFEAYIQEFLVVDLATRLNRLMLITYMALFTAMWWVYFQSKLQVSNGQSHPYPQLEVQTLRRLLGFTSVHWDESAVNNAELVASYRNKGTAGMQVLAILIAVSLLIFDEIGDIWGSDKAASLWQHDILWAGMLAAAMAFVCFVLCVDAFDTMFNQFRTHNVRNVLVNYFYRYTINPRYIATASLLVSMVLLLAFYSEVLSAFAIGCIVIFGYGFWFPDIRAACQPFFDTPPGKPRYRHRGKLATAILLAPFVWQIVVIAWSAHA
ncbi:MAG: hypothetical protein DIZ78_00210 [endosymbiont of Escarpia spicata]|uniref:Uncharacterized protein n=1 Tax=endosymbiont of Escarpia spicata TaxID=2200908 RepID=A0A370DVD5_9GAMM|nr:MAG: hypothetical protein DIZ78_00210 [endosymbiont of Escarpia spicata]